MSFDGRASSDPDGTISSYAWTFGDGGAAAGSTPSHSYAKRGTFTVQLAVTDNSGSVGVTAKSLAVSSGNSGGGPVVRLRIPRQRLGSVVRRGLDVDVSSSEAATAKLRLVLPASVAKTLGLGNGSRPVVIGTKTHRIPAHKDAVVRLTVFPRAGHDLRSVKSVVARLTATVTGSSGKTSASRRLLLRR